MGGGEEGEARANDPAGRKADEPVLRGESHQGSPMLHSELAVKFAPDTTNGGRAQTKFQGGRLVIAAVADD